MDSANYLALLLFERRLGGETVGYTEEIHLLTADNPAEAEAAAQERGRAQATSYLAADGQPVDYALLRVVSVQPFLFGTEQEAIFTRSFDDLAAYREVATLRGPLPSDLVTPTHLPALAAALNALFGPHLSAEAESNGIGFRWRGRDFGSFGTVGMEQQTFAEMALNTAHDVVLEGMGEDGEHPGPLLHAAWEARAEAGGWRLCLTLENGEQREALWQTAE